MVSKKQCCLTAAVFAGMLVGGLVGGVMADAYGRRPIVLLNLGINAVSALLSALSPSLNWLILFRCLAGIGVGGIVSCLFALCVEHLPTSARARYITILCSFWMVVRCIRICCLFRTKNRSIYNERIGLDRYSGNGVGDARQRRWHAHTYIAMD
ncbi:hypothetical protein DYB25_008768 [Aphanomyces astaci]|uniref:Major facilitator superfamily (MFS) profile domain-containing protein n=1 Tax=Aphanomyces astaci TaxID=112090 RepID=A0A397BG07_APHAT|nr:hypothetical protein DYB25_008768 [Aphanomyces astaci]RHZ12337.1 hypothetical protein DYB26_014450 [Aphanomyces astaci]